MAGPVTLPEGFKLDAPQGGGLPAGFKLDALQPESPYSFKNLAGAAIEPNLHLGSGAIAAPLAGLAGIAGTLLPGPEGQGAAWTQRVQDALTYNPQSQGGQTATGAITYPFRKFGEGADWAGGKVADITGSPALGASVNTAIQAVPMAAGAKLGAPMAGETIKPLESGGQKLMQSSLKPSWEELRKGKGQRAVNTLLEEGINPTAGGVDTLRTRLSNITDKTNEIIGNSGEMVSVSKQKVGERIDPLVARARAQVNPAADVQALEGARAEFNQHPAIQGDSISVALAQQLKQGTYRALGERPYGELQGATTEAQKALARGLKEEISTAVPEVAPLNARASDLANAMNIARRRALIDMNKNPLSLAPLAHHPVGLAAYMADKSALAKAVLARLLYQSAHGIPASRPATFAGMAGTAERNQ